MRFAIVAIALTCGATDDGARAVLSRTKNTNATYASYQWMVQRDENGGDHDGWAAEFHRGDWHRIENQWRRAVANCRTHKGFILEVATGEIQRLDASNVCGVDDTVPITSVVRLPSIPASGYGALDVIRVIDEHRVRSYQVDRRGALVWVNWSPRDGLLYPCLTQESAAILTTLRADDIFTRKSLAVAATPSRYQQRPMHFAVNGLPGIRCD